MPESAADAIRKSEDLLDKWRKMDRDKEQDRQIALRDAAAELQNAIRSETRTNPSATNYVFDIAPELGVLKRAPQLTNIPNSVVIVGHGAKPGGPPFLPWYSTDRRGFHSGKYTGPVTDALFKMSSVENNYNLDDMDRLKPIHSGAGPVTLQEMAKSLGNATNDVKKAFIISCFNAGYTYDDVKAVFPNLEKLIGSRTDMSTTGYYANDLFRKEGKEDMGPGYPGISPHIAPPGYPQFSPLYSMTPTRTNEINNYYDWAFDPFPVPPYKSKHD